MICFDLLEQKKFIVFSCNHKVCNQCYPKLTHCPLCDIELVKDTCRVLQCVCVVSRTIVGMFILRVNT